MSSAPARTAGCCATMPTGRPPSRANPTSMLPAHIGWISRKSASSTTRRITSCMSYGFDDSSGTTASSAASIRSDGSVGVTIGASARLFCGRCARSRRTWSIASASSDAARCATPLRPVCTPRPTERLRVDLLMGHGLHDVGAGDEHVARALDHHGEVRHRRRVDSAAGARSEDDRDLRHDARRQDVAQEDLRVPAEGRDAFLDSRPAGIVEADDRRADLHREVHDLADLLGIRLRERPAEDREVLAEDEHQPPVDRAVSGDDAVAEEELLVEPELRRAVGDERVQLDERARVQEEVQSLARRELAPRVLSLDADRTAALQRLGPQLLESRDSFGVRRHGRGLLRSPAGRLCAKTGRGRAIIGR